MKPSNITSKFNIHISYSNDVKEQLTSYEDAIEKLKAQKSALRWGIIKYSFACLGALIGLIALSIIWL